MRRRMVLLGWMWWLVQSSMVWSQALIFHQANPPFADVPVNWSGFNGGGQAIYQAATNGYLLVDHQDDWVVSESYDLSLFQELSLSLDIAPYGSGDHNRLTIEVSADNGLTWTAQQIETDFTSETIYAQQGPYSITVFSTQVRFRFRRLASSGRGVRFRNIRLEGQYQTCGNESFSQLPSNSSTNYLNRSWIADDGTTWLADGARTDQILNGKAICWGTSGDRNLTTPVYPQGLGELRFKYVRAFTGTASRRLEVLVNGLLVAEIPVSPTSDDIMEFAQVFNIPGDVVLKIRSVGSGQVMIDDLQWSCYEKPGCFNSTHQYRSIASGNWSNADIWVSSPDAVGPWVATSCTPDFRSPLIRIGSGHVVVMDEMASVRNLMVETGAELNYREVELNVMGGDTGGLTLEGVFNHDNTTVFPRLFAPVRVMAGGAVMVSRNKPGSADFYAGTDSQGMIVYHTGSAFVWNLGLAFPTAERTYFPFNDEETIAVFRVNTNMANVGANTYTIINGIFEANGNLTWQNSGPKIFRNGLKGNAILTQSATSGRFIINGLTATLGFAGGLNLGVAGLEITSPELMLNANLHVGQGPFLLSGTIHAGNYHLGLGGDMVVTESGFFNPQTSTLVIDGSVKQNLQLSNPLQLYNLQIANEAGIVVDNDVHIQNTLTMSSGVIQNDGHVLSLGLSSAQMGVLAHANGYVTGIFRRWVGADPDVVWEFPVGKRERFNPFALQFDSGSSQGVIAASFMDDIPASYYGNLPLWADGIFINTLSDAGFWRIEQEEGLSTTNYRLSLNANGFPGILDPDQVRILKSTTGLFNWEYSGDFESFENGIMVQSGMQGFSDFALGSNFMSNPLPVELLYFSSTPDKNTVRLDWATASETNNHFFSLERSRDFRHVEEIGILEGAGNSNRILTYRFTDMDPLSGLSYYRLKQTDYDGAYAYGPWSATQLPDLSELDLKIIDIKHQNQQGQMLIQAAAHKRLHIRVVDLQGRVWYDHYIFTEDVLTTLSFYAAMRGLILVTVSDGSRNVRSRLFIP